MLGQLSTWKSRLEETTWLELEQVSRVWLQDKATAEKRFSLGRFDRDYLGRSPIAVVRVQGQIAAFANLVRSYGTRAELSVDMMRYRPEVPAGTMDYLFTQLIGYAKAQGYPVFSLGMAPLSGVADTRYARLGEKIARLAYEYGNRFYNYKGLRSFKEKYHPEWRSAYLAYPPFTPVPTLLIDIAALVAGGYRRILFK
jgi:phosphatidylglycerol lysyltransferase